METEPNNLATQPTPTPEQAQSKKPFYKKVWFLTVAALGVLLLLGPPIIGYFLKMGSYSGGAAATVFYDMIENAAQQTKVRYAYEQTRPEGGDDPALTVKSLTEYDQKTKEYSTVYASQYISGRAGRCVKGKSYKSTTDRFPDTMAQAEEALRGPAEEAINSQGTSFDYCDFKSTKFQGNFTDGILPVGITKQQAQNMVAGLQGRDFIVLTDGGHVTFKGKKVRKISFEISQQKTGKLYKADTFFYAYRDGNSGDVNGNGINLDAINEQFNIGLRLDPAPGLEGFYLIDEQSKLPVYGEFTTTPDGIENFIPESKRSMYEFNPQFKIDQQTQLEALPKPE